MLKLSLTATAAFLFLSATAMAGSQSWNVTEENTSGVKSAQGTWVLNIEGDKLSGDADLQLSNGNPLTYSVQGSVSGGVYTITLENRSDGKKGCVWTGHAPQAGGTQAHGLLGEAACQGSKLIIRTSW